MRPCIVKVAAFAPPVLVSTLLVLCMAPLLPPALGWVLLLGGPAVAVFLLSRSGEALAVRALFRARPLTDEEQADLAPALALLCQSGLGHPVIRLWVQPRVVPVASGGVGRHSVTVSGGMVGALRDRQLPDDQAAAVIAHAAGVVRAGVVRSDAVLEFWTLPWQIVRTVAVRAARFFAWLPFTALAWRMRWIVSGVALVQGVLDGRAVAMGAGVAAAVVFAISYAVPVLGRAWAAVVTETGDRAVLDVGMGESMARFLRRCSGPDRSRINRLDSASAVPVRPRLAVVPSR